MLKVFALLALGFVFIFILEYFLFQDRKVIIKSLKTNIVKVCKEEYGHMVLLSIFDSVDDTKLVRVIVLDVSIDD